MLKRIMKRPLTDREILRAIYDTYLPKFAGFDRENRDRVDLNYVPIDVDHVGSKLGSDGDMIFGRLFFHMDRQHGYQNARGAYVHLFAKAVGTDTNCVNFPLLTAVLADMEDRTRRYWTATTIAVVSLAISGASMLVAVFA